MSTHDDFRNASETERSEQQVSNDTKSPRQIAMPVRTFETCMLNPESWPIDGHVGLLNGTVISTDEWVKMQEAALDNLTGDIRVIATQVMVTFWENIVNGIVPNGLRITRPDPITKMR